MKNEKGYLVIIFTLLFMSIVLLLGFGIQSIRLERSMERCEQYRAELVSAQSRESEIGECISRTSVILSETSNTVEGLRKKLEAVEDSYNHMWELLSNNNRTNDSNVFNQVGE